MRLVGSPVAAGPSPSRAQRVLIAALAIILSAAFPQSGATAPITCTPSSGLLEADPMPIGWDLTDRQVLNTSTGTQNGFDEGLSAQVVPIKSVPVSEPSSLLLLGAGIAILTRLGRRAFSARH
jgi:hypothetical protein